MKSLAWFSGIVVSAFVVGCGNADGDLAAVAQQAISELEQADAESVSACESEAERCREANASSEGLATCQALAESCQKLEQRLGEVRNDAIGCWQEAAGCDGDGCEQHADACQMIGEAVGEARKPVIECAHHVQACMTKAAGSSQQQQMAELCGELDGACGQGVVAGSVERVRLRAQECLGEGDATLSRTGDASQAPVSGSDPAAPDAGAAPQGSLGEGSAEQSGEIIEQRQQACLGTVALCGEAAASPDADLARIRQSGEACDWVACQS